MGGYHQWQLPKIYKTPQSKNSTHQKERFSKILNNWHNTLKEKNTIVMIDTNIDMSNNGHNKSWNVENLKVILFDFLNLFKLIILNKKFKPLAKCLNRKKEYNCNDGH